MAAINYLLNVKHVPVGGTSASCAILGGFYYSGENGSITAREALSNPYDTLLKVYNTDFLQQVITDQHYLTRNRQGRHVGFLALIVNDQRISVKGIADERAAFCIDEKGMAVVLGSSKAYFLLADVKKSPEICNPKQPLIWNCNKQAIKVYELQGTENGTGSFDVVSFNPGKPSGGKWYWWWVDKGELKQQRVN